jgi:signal transduction histidine kinase/CheY-like chemotaxis protein
MTCPASSIQRLSSDIKPPESGVRRQASSIRERGTEHTTTILVVDDRAPDRELLTYLLKHARYRVLEAADGAEALQLAQAEHPDLVISDVLLPKMDGYDLVRELRTDPSFARTPIIFYTAVFSEKEARDLARNGGVAHILTKPTDPQKILDIVAETLRAKEAEKISPLPDDFEQKHNQLLIDKLMQQIDVLRQSEERMTWQNAVLEGINRIFKQTISSHTQEDLGWACLKVAEEITGSKFGFIGEIGSDGLLHDIAISETGWELCTMYDQTGHRKPPGNFKVHGLYGRVLQDGKSLLTNTPAEHPDSIGTPAGHPPLTAFLGVPLIRDGRTIGMIAMGNRDGGYSQKDLEALEALAPAVAEAVASKRAEEALKQAHRELEIRVQERTLNLSETVEMLRAENIQRKRLEDTLRESENQVRFFASQCLTAQETERKRIAGELHDSIAASLGAIKFSIEKFAGEMKQGAGNPESVLDLASKVAQTADEVRRIMADLRPSILDDLGIIPAIKWFCREFEKTYSHICVEKHIDLAESDVTDSLKTAIYRISQEAMNNIAKHSKASLVKLGLQEEDGKITLTIEDNGQGFDPENAIRGLGLSTMRERAELSGGNYTFESTEGRGTVIRASWPI